MQTRVCRLHDKHDIRIETETVADPGPGQVVVAIGAGGICGSDLHYFHDGGFGSIRLREPMILGHEVAGTIVAVGADAGTLREGDRVALNPNRSCGKCRYCREGLGNQCLDVLFYGSAMRFPHVQGAFRDRIVAEATQCETIGNHVTLGEAACAEPLAVCLHAGNQAGDMAGKRVLVTGAGPIGALCTAVARHAGAAEIVVTDLQDATLAVAEKMGATKTVNIATAPDALEPYMADKGTFDIAFECSAAAPAIRSAIATVRPRGTIVQVGVTGDVPLPINLLVSKEIVFKGTHRFFEEYAQAVALIDSGSIDVKPIITATYPLDDALSAFQAAGDRTRSVKVQMSFS